MGRETHRLFFALRPPPPIAIAIEQVAVQLAAARRIAGKWLKPAKYHITLHFLGTYDHLPADVRERAVAAGADFATSAPDVECDRIASFERVRSPPCVLRCSPRADSTLQALSRDLRSALATAGLAAHEEHAYTPHLTIGYGDRALAEPIRIEPLAWQAHELLLIDSHVGTGRHEALAHWRLDA